MTGSWVLLGTWVCCRGSCGRSTRTRAPVLGASGSTKWMVPPWRSVTQRAMARPRPVPPPPSASASVPNRSKTRSRSAAGTPGPSSATSRRQPVAVSRAVTRTTPPAGLCRDALSSRLATSWWSRAGSAVAVSAGGVARTSYLTSRPATRASATARSSSARTGTCVVDSWASPASTRARSSRSEARVASRSAWSSAVRRATGSGSATPSTRFSSTAHRAATGVRSSWLTFATSSRRWRSTAARSSAIRLKARASSPTSSLEVAVTRPE